MSSTNLEIVFEGSGVQAGTINARLLADALIGCSDVFTRANQILNGEASEAVVLVQSDFKRGSFVVDVQLVQDVVEHARQLITAHPFLSAGSLAGIIGFISKNKEAVKDSLIELYKPEFGGQICETCRARRSLSTPNANGSAIPSPVSLRKSQWFPSNGGFSTPAWPCPSPK